MIKKGKKRWLTAALTALVGALLGLAQSGTLGQEAELLVGPVLDVLGPVAEPSV